MIHFERLYAFFKEKLRVLWQSPTLATWLNQFVSMARLLLVMPLILTRFDAVEIACWLLFGSLNIFGTLLASRLSVSFSRMIAFAMAGATNLAPIKSVGENRGDGIPKWDLVAQVYATLSAAQYALAVLSGLIALGMGIMGLGNLLENYHSKLKIEIAFVIFIISNVLLFMQGRYAVTLVGLNKVTQVNRINAIVGVASIIGGLIVLLCDGRILLLSIVMQAISLCGVVYNKSLLSQITREVGLNLQNATFSGQVLRWAWTPVWKSMSGMLAGTGLLQLSGIISARYNSVDLTASYLFANRLLMIVMSLSDVPFYSKVPRFARWVSGGEIRSLQKEIPKRLRHATALQAVGYCGIAIFISPILHIIGSKVKFIPVEMWLAMGCAMLVIHFSQLAIATASLGNDFVFPIHQLGVFILGAILLPVGAILWGLWGIIIAIYLPSFLLICFGTINVGAAYIGMSARPYTNKILAAPLCGYLIVATTILITNALC